MLLGRFFSQFTAQPTNAGGRVNDPPLQRVCDKLEFAKKRGEVSTRCGRFMQGAKTGGEFAQAVTVRFVKY
jgi:hypothetical protein